MLSDLQLKFKQAILSSQKDSLEWVAEKPPLTPAERIDIYSFAYFARLTDSLREDFEILEKALEKESGEGSFDRLAQDFFKNHPSRFCSANEVNAAFPEYASNSSNNLSALQAKPWLIDLIRFEWSLVEAFYARNLDRTGTAEMATAIEADWEAAKLILDPSVSLISSEWDLLGLIETPTQAPARKETHLLVYRKESEPHWQEITPGQKTLLNRFSQKTPLKTATAGLEPHEFDAEVFSSWWGGGIIRAIEWSSRSH